MLLNWIKGTFNGEEGHRQKSSVQSIMHRIIGYYRLISVSGILLSNWKFEMLLICQTGILHHEKYMKYEIFIWNMIWNMKCEIWYETWNMKYFMLWNNATL